MIPKNAIFVGILGGGPLEKKEKHFRVTNRSVGRKSAALAFSQNIIQNQDYTLED